MHNETTPTKALPPDFRSPNNQRPWRTAMSIDRPASITDPTRLTAPAGFIGAIDGHGITPPPASRASSHTSRRARAARRQASHPTYEMRSSSTAQQTAHHSARPTGPATLFLARLHERTRRKKRAPALDSEQLQQTHSPAANVSAFAETGQTVLRQRRRWRREWRLILKTYANAAPLPLDPALAPGHFLA